MRKADVLRILKDLGYPIILLCSIFGISRQSFYNYIDYYCDSSPVPQRVKEFFDLVTTEGITKNDVNEFLLKLCKWDTRTRNYKSISDDLLKFFVLHENPGDVLTNRTPTKNVDPPYFIDMSRSVRDARIAVTNYSTQAAFSKFGSIGIPTSDQYRVSIHNLRLQQLYTTYFDLMFLSTYIRTSTMLRSGLDDIVSILDYIDYEMDCIEYIFRNLDEVDSDELYDLLDAVNRDSFDVSRKSSFFMVTVLVADGDSPEEVYPFVKVCRATDNFDASYAGQDYASKICNGSTQLDFAVFGPFSDQDEATSALFHIKSLWKDDFDDVKPPFEEAQKWLNEMKDKKSLKWSGLR